MNGSLRERRTILGITIMLIGSTGMGSHSISLADEGVVFPWTATHSTNSASVPREFVPPAITLAPIEEGGVAVVPRLPAPPKARYPYGWFGSDPTSQWSRHFGFGHSYMQWSRR